MTEQLGTNGRTALYRYFDAEGNLLYLGITNDLHRRNSGHSRDSANTWFPLVASRAEEWFESREEAATAERSALEAEAPPWNSKDTLRATPESWQAYRERQRRKRIKTVRVDPGNLTEVAVALCGILTEYEVEALVTELRAHSPAAPRTGAKPVPPYRQHANEIIERIRSGQLKPGNQAPSAREIMQATGISSATAARVLAVLRDEGWTDPVPGRGSFVRSRP